MPSIRRAVIQSSSNAFTSRPRARARACPDSRKPRRAVARRAERKSRRNEAGPQQGRSASSFSRFAPSRRFRRPSSGRIEVKRYLTYAPARELDASGPSRLRQPTRFRFPTSVTRVPRKPRDKADSPRKGRGRKLEETARSGKGSRRVSREDRERGGTNCAGAKMNSESGVEQRRSFGCACERASTHERIHACTYLSRKLGK